jgi:two-component system response regulator HydG
MTERAPEDRDPALEPPRPEPGLDPAALLHQLLDTLPAGIFTIDAVGTITSWNRGMEELTGFSALEMLGQPCTSLAADGCSGGVLGTGFARCPLFRDGEVRERRCTIRRRGGGRVPVRIDGRTLRDGRGRVIGAFETVGDLEPLARLEERVAALRDEAAARRRFDGLLGKHPTMLALGDAIEAAGRSDYPVLIQGETGTGKGLVARAIHAASRRRAGPFVRVPCTALSDRLLDAELFGRGDGSPGRLAAARGGTLFLDEVADLAPVLQDKLLRVLGSPDGRWDLRVVAATHGDLGELAAQGRFGLELYRRLSAIPMRVPPLRERASDVPILAEHFLSRLARASGRAVSGFTPEAMARLIAYDWPGNVRELEHAVEYALVLVRGELVDEAALPPPLAASSREPGEEAGAVAPRPKPGPDRERILDALARTQGNRTRAAKLLGISRVTLWKWMRSLGMQPDDGGTQAE